MSTERKGRRIFGDLNFEPGGSHVTDSALRTYSGEEDFLHVQVADINYWASLVNNRDTDTDNAEVIEEMEIIASRYPKSVLQDTGN